MIRVGSTCLHSGTLSAQSMAFRDNTQSEQNLTKMELLNALIALSWRESSLCSLNRSCHPPSGGMQPLLLSMCMLKVVLYHSVLWLIFVFSPLSPNCPLVHFTCFAHISLNSCPFDFSLLSSYRLRMRAHLCCTRALIASHARLRRVHLFPY